MEMARRYARRVLGNLPGAKNFLRAARSRARQRFLKLLPAASVGAEVGVWKGDFSEEILRTVRPSQLHLVDPWAFQPAHPDRWYGGLVASEQAAMDKIYQDVCARFARHGNVKIHRRFSSDLLEIFPKHSLDWIYIDGDHSREAVRNDLLLALDVVKPGGVIGGDDYFWRDSDGSRPVKAAVIEVAKDRKLELKVIDNQFAIMRP
jgi:hypothetical protein